MKKYWEFWAKKKRPSEEGVKSGKEFLEHRRKQVQAARDMALKAEKKKEAAALKKRRRYTDSSGPH